jgi:hypothetical protein
MRPTLYLAELLGVKTKKPANFDVQPAEQSRELWFFPLPASRPVARSFIHGVLGSTFDCNRKMHREFAYETALAFILCHRCHNR